MRNNIMNYEKIMLGKLDGHKKKFKTENGEVIHKVLKQSEFISMGIPDSNSIGQGTHKEKTKYFCK